MELLLLNDGINKLSLVFEKGELFAKYNSMKTKIKIIDIFEDDEKGIFLKNEYLNFNISIFDKDLNEYAAEVAFEFYDYVNDNNLIELSISFDDLCELLEKY